LEQPIPVKALADQKIAFEQSVLPLIADESCQVETDVEKCAAYFHGINIKLNKCGGLTPARRMIAKARALNLKVMVGCMTESSVGISAIAHLLPLLDYVDMDGALLLAEDIATGVTIDYGKISYADRPGTGAELML
ncbi:MAG: enolase C-terminal domain-like protein, partial [Bacteroidota bacterium]